jgi:NAD(P)-dependent dehydrogenase (short-subunit alcohol dehydrogenase family)
VPGARHHVDEIQLTETARPIALVTGGGSGIGAACARRLAADGYDIAVCDLDLDSASAVAADCGAGSRAVEVDVGDEASVQQMMDAVAAMPGVLTAAVNSAAIADNGGPIADCDFADWRRVLAVDLDGVFLCVRAELRSMLASSTRGSITSIGSVLGLRGHANVPTYTTAKHALIGLHRSAALAYSGHGIRANVVCPGYVRTPLLDARMDYERMAGLVAQHPIGRLGSAEDVAGVVSWLAGPDSTFVSGAVYTVDGGFTS